MHPILLTLLVGVILTHPAPSWAFDNIEADAAYDRVIKPKIEVEFRQGLKALKAQALGLNMSVREHDLTTLAEHMYDKAHLMGACTDQGITIQKTINPKIELDRFIASCVATHLKFAQEQQRRTFVDNNLPLTSEERLNSDFQKLQYDRCMMQSSRPVLQGKVNPPYEFLKVEPMYLPKNYLSRKRCFDSSRN